MFSDKGKGKGRIILEERAKNGKWRKIREATNLVTYAGRDALLQNLTSSGSTLSLDYMAVSDDTGSASANHTTLTGEYGRYTVDAGYPSYSTSTHELTVICTLATTEGNGTIRKIAFFDSASGGVMWNELDITAYTKTNATELRVTYTFDMNTQGS